MDSRIKWAGLGLSYFLLRRASEIWAYNGGFVHSAFCLTSGDPIVFEDSYQFRWVDRKIADRVDVTENAKRR